MTRDPLQLVDLLEKAQANNKILVGNLKLALHHIFNKIGYNFDILNENSVASLNLEDLRTFWGDYCKKNNIQGLIEPAKAEN